MPLLFHSEYLIRVNTEAQFSFPMVRVKIVQDHDLHIGSSIQGYVSPFLRTESSIEFFSLTNLGPDLLVSTDIGYLYRISWDGSMHQNLTITLNTLAYTMSLNGDRSSISTSTR